MHLPTSHIAPATPSKTSRLITSRSPKKTPPGKSPGISRARFQLGIVFRDPGGLRRLLRDFLRRAPPSRQQNDKKPPLQIATTFEIRLSTVGKVFPLSGNDRPGRNVRETQSTLPAKMASYNPTKDRTERPMHRLGAMKIIRDAEEGK